MSVKVAFNEKSFGKLLRSLTWQPDEVSDTLFTAELPKEWQGGWLSAIFKTRLQKGIEKLKKARKLGGIADASPTQITMNLNALTYWKVDPFPAETSETGTFSI